MTLPTESLAQGHQNKPFANPEYSPSYSLKGQWQLQQPPSSSQRSKKIWFNHPLPPFFFKPHQMWKEPQHQTHSICTSETFITERWAFPHLITLPLALAVWQCSEKAVFPGPLNHKFTHSSPKLHAVSKIIIKKDHFLQYTNHAATDFFYPKDKDWG